MAYPYCVLEKEGFNKVRLKENTRKTKGRAEHFRDNLTTLLLISLSSDPSAVDIHIMGKATSNVKRRAIIISPKFSQIVAF